MISKDYGEMSVLFSNRFVKELVLFTEKVIIAPIFHQHVALS